MKSLCQLALILLIAVPFAQASNDRIVTAVFSAVYNGYERPKAADGSFEPQYYALANGIFTPGLSVDNSIDKIKFPQVAGLVAQFLALRNYRLAKESKQTDFLLIISWGKTMPFNDSVGRESRNSAISALNDYKRMTHEAQEGGAARGPDGAASPAMILAQEAQNNLQNELYQMQAFSDMRRNADERNARLLGYVDEINRRNNVSLLAGNETAYYDLISDLENERYYIVISAYDFKTAVKEGKRKLLWATRVSIQASGNRFNEAAGLMLAKASKYFGQNSGRLIQEFERTGNVRLGELQVVGIVPESNLTTTAKEKK